MGASTPYLDLWNPSDLPLLDQLAALRREFAPRQREALVACLSTALTKRQAGPAAIEQLTLLSQADSVCILAGQQPVIGGGPLYNLLKACHVVLLARQLRQQGIKAVPMFWCASEDHDLGEAGHLDLIRRDGSIQALHHAFGKAGSLHYQDAQAAWQLVTQALAEHWPAALGAQWWQQQAPDPAEDMGSWFCRLIQNLLAADGLVVFQAHEIRELVPTTFWQRASSEWPADALQAQSQAMHKQGLALSFTDLSQAPVFADRVDGRQALDAIEIDTVLAEDPLLLSPGAALRPALQQTVLPCAIYCGGPGELAYHAQIAPVFRQWQIPQQVLLPRLTARLLPNWLERSLAAWNVDADAITADALPAHNEVGNIRLDKLDAALEDLLEQAKEQNHNLHKRLHSAHARLLHERQRLADSLKRHQRQESGRTALGILQAQLWPRGKPQERVLSIAQCIWQHGPGLVNVLLDQLHTDTPGRLQNIQIV